MHLGLALELSGRRRHWSMLLLPMNAFALHDVPEATP